MRIKSVAQEGLLSQLSVEDALHGVGLELLLKAEELMYATGTLSEEECYEVGSDIYLLSTVLASVLIENGKALKQLGVQLPADVGAVRIKNPYYARSSERPSSEDEGQSTASGGVVSSIDEIPF
jgi:hypothetical protein